MNPDRNTDEALERLLDHTLRDLPPRRAPQSLEGRVTAALAQRAAGSPGRWSFVLWTGPARAGFVAICSAVMALTLLGGGTAVTALQRLPLAAAPPLAWARHALTVTGAAAELAAVLVRTVPAAWAYGGLAASAALYALLFGLAGAAFRTLYLNAPPTGRKAS
jgi:hypothetical protein